MRDLTTLPDLKLALVQTAPVWQDPAANHAHFARLLGQAEGADLVILPEMFATGFSMDAAALAEAEDGPSRAWLLGQAARPDAVVLVSPHAAREARAYAMTSCGVSGSLARFGASRASVRLPGDAALTASLREAAAARGIETAGLPASQLDHGSVVPLWYLVQAGWDGARVVVALAMEDNSRIGELGECVAAVATLLGRRVAVVASGDMSHRLQPGAPCGYDPEAAKFDREFIVQLRRGGRRVPPSGQGGFR